MINLFISILCAYLWWEGGGKNGWARDIIIPIIVGSFIGFINQNIILGILSIGSMNIIRIGYGAYDPEHDDIPSFLGWLTRDHEGYIIRSIVGAYYIFIGSMPLLLYKIYFNLDFEWDKVLGFILCNAFIGGTFSFLKLKRGIIEPIIGFFTVLFILSL